jgi:NitT/TauT family transport system substrate-binding protein
MQVAPSRRHFLTGLSAVGLASVVCAGPLHAEPPPEITAVRLPVFYKISDCQSPAYISTELLRAEGFTDVQFVATGTGPDDSDWLAAGDIDFDWNFAPAYIRAIIKGGRITVLAGMHAGCNELIAKKDIRSVAGLKGRKVGVDLINGSPHAFLTLMAAYVGLDPVNDIQWIANPDEPPLELLAEGKIDAFLGGPPAPQQARARNIGHTIVDMGADAPWSQYFCCMLAGSADYVSRYPVATKRVLRALVKAVDLCVSDPERVARLVVERGFAARYDYALQALKQVRYDKWREYDPEDTMRFYALRMRETGLIAENPNEIISKSTDWRFLNELKRELKT